MKFAFSTVAVILFSVVGCTDNQPGGSSPPDLLGKTEQRLVGTPFTPRMTQAHFDSAHAMTYSSGNKCFLSGGNCYYFSIVQDQGGLAFGVWELVAATALSNGSAWGIDQGTFDVISGGTWTTTPAGCVGTITYGGSKYMLRAVRNTSDGLNRMEAYTITCS